MTARTPPAFLSAGSHIAENVRNVFSALVGAQGVVGSGDLAVTANGTPNMSVNVAAGAAFIKGSLATLQGMYHAFNDATLNVTIAASDPTNPRNDLVVAEIRDNDYGGGGFNDFRLRVVTGTPAGSPVDPATPANALVLARVRVDASVASIVAGKITDLRAKGSAQDLYAGQTATAGPPTNGNYVAGQYIFDINGVVWACTASGLPGTWKPSSDPAMYGVGGSVVTAPPALTAAAFKIQAGSTVGVVGANGALTVAFPAAFPNGVLTIIATAGDNTAAFATARVNQPATTLSGFTVECITTANIDVANGSTVRLNWIAVGW